MAHVYSSTGKKISLTLSPDDVGVRFETPEVAAQAFRSVRASVSRAVRGVAPGDARYKIAPRRFDRTMLLHDPGAARTAISTVRNALSARLMTNVRRTLPVYVEDESQLRVIVTREITVRFKPKTTRAQQTKVLTDLGLTIKQTNEFNRYQFVVIPGSDIDESETIRAANRLSERPEVEYAAPNFVSESRKLATTNDPQLRAQWYLNNSGLNDGLEGEDVRAFEAWDITPGGKRSIVIAIVDDGVDLEHPDLQANIWVNPKATAPDRNGRNFFDDDFNPRPRYFASPYNDTQLNDIHGTPCAGVAAAVGNNRTGVAGIAYRCRILAVKVFGGEGLAPNDRIADAIRYAGLKADVISNSWAVARNADVESAVDDVVRTGRRGKGCLVFCATGNEYRPYIGFPANHPSALAVGASNDQGKRSKYSNRGPGMHFVAPSDDFDRERQGITTTDVSIRNRGYASGAYCTDFGGTSSSTPLAAGIGALVLSVNPSLTWKQARSILRSTADKIDLAGRTYKKGYSIHYGYGRLNAFKAVKRAAGGAKRKGTKARKGAKKR
jgi:subtilisin family serine protease